jgi:phospholipid-binding lipoprotein MlaA
MTNITFARFRSIASLALFGIFVAGCSITEPGTINDPQEAANRRAHNFNKGLDKNLIKPVSKFYGSVVPPSADSKVGNFASHLAIPGEIVNSALQFNFQDVTINTIRFLTNTVFGFGGFYDFATAAGMEEDVDTDFGETLAVWGFPEGEYIEVPVFGPRTERETWGIFVDSFLNPLNLAGVPEGIQRIKTPAYIIDKVGDRNQYADLIDGILYSSEDSYTTARSIYLQRRRFKLNRGVNLDDLEDPYAN